MEGLFEIHVSVNPKDILQFRLWCLDNDVKAINILGEIPELTFSKYTNGNSEKAYNKAMSITRNLTLNNIQVSRVRIEMIFSNRDPIIDSHMSDNSYFEFHIKFHIINSKDYNELVNIAKDFNNIHKDSGIYSFVGFNSFKKNVEPIISLRVPSNKLSSGALEFKNLLMTYLKERGFRTNEEIHKEYVFYDKEFYSKL